jgi:hypothetical protein
MPANNSQINRNRRRAEALQRFSISPIGSLRTRRTPEQKAEADKGYVGRKNIEREALSKARSSPEL